jgi:acetolactate synthase-1/3 small subunit
MKKETDHTYTLTLQVRNHPGVLVRCAQVYGRRGHNIEALHVSSNSNPDYSTMTITAFGQANMMDRIVAQLQKLIDVQDVKEREN